MGTRVAPIALDQTDKEASMISNKMTVIALSAVGLAAFGCSHDRETMTPASRSMSAPEQRDRAADGERALSDAQIAGIMEAANTAEIQQGSIAQRMAQRQEVRDFATMMVMDHSKALDEGQRLSTNAGFGTAESELQTELRAENQETVSELNDAKPSDFDEEYMESQVKAHEKVLELLDDKLIPNAVNPELRSALIAKRSVVAAHLERARNIKSMVE
jgi:putative membrane protein